MRPRFGTQHVNFGALLSKRKLFTDVPKSKAPGPPFFSAWCSRYSVLTATRIIIIRLFPLRQELKIILDVTLLEFVSPIKPVKSLIPAWPSSFVLDKLEFTVVKLNPLAHISWLTKGLLCVCVRANRIYLACPNRGCGDWQSG